MKLNKLQFLYIKYKKKPLTSYLSQSLYQLYYYYSVNNDRNEQVFHIKVFDIKEKINDSNQCKTYNKKLKNYLNIFIFIDNWW